MKSQYKNGAHMVAQLVEVLCYKPEGCRFNSPWVSLESFIDLILPWPLG
jgi:hypothetical protein